MAITSLDGVLAGFRPPYRFSKAITPTLVAGRPHSLWYLAGRPGAASTPTGGLSGTALSSTGQLVNGQIPFFDPTGNNFCYLARLSAQCAQQGTLVLCDRLWHNSGITITSTSQQTINSVTFPARDVNGSTNGEGVVLGVEVSAATGSGTPTLTVIYTNSEGTSGRSGANIQPTAASSAIGAFYELSLQVGDTGVRSVQYFNLSTSWTSGTIHLVAYRVIAEVHTPVSAADVFGTAMARLYNGSVPFLLFFPQTTTAVQISGSITFTHG